MTKQQIIIVLKPLTIIEVILLVGLGLVCYFGGWHSIKNYAVAMMVAGAFLVTVGPFSTSIPGQNYLMNDNMRLLHPMQREQLIRQMRDVRLHQSTSLPYFAQLLMIDGALTYVLGIVLQVLVR